MDDHGVEFVGTFDYGVDAKHRIAIPAKFRAAVPETMGSEFAILPGWTTVPCLWIWPALIFRQLELRFRDPRHVGNEEMQLCRMALLRDLTRETPDTQGRVVLSERQRKHAGIDRQVQLVANGDRFECWNPEYLEHWLGLLEVEPGKREEHAKVLRKDGLNRAAMAKRFFELTEPARPGGNA